MFFQNILDRGARNAPFRMTLGKLGIRLVAVGRWLQVRYANWNSEFRLNFRDLGTRNYADFEVSEEIVSVQCLTFSARSSQIEKQPDLVKALFNIKGVTGISLYPYIIRIVKAEVFGWDELRPDIEAAILKHLAA